MNREPDARRYAFAVILPADRSHQSDGQPNQATCNRQPLRPVADQKCSADDRDKG